jgi:hypothetical protein
MIVSEKFENQPRLTIASSAGACHLAISSGAMPGGGWCHQGLVRELDRSVPAPPHPITLRSQLKRGGAAFFAVFAKSAGFNSLSSESNKDNCLPSSAASLGLGDSISRVENHPTPWKQTIVHSLTRQSRSSLQTTFVKFQPPDAPLWAQFGRNI